MWLLRFVRTACRGRIGGSKVRPWGTRDCYMCKYLKKVDQFGEKVKLRVDPESRLAMVNYVENLWYCICTRYNTALRWEWVTSDRKLYTSKERPLYVIRRIECDYYDLFVPFPWIHREQEV